MKFIQLDNSLKTCKASKTGVCYYYTILTSISWFFIISATIRSHGRGAIEQLTSLEPQVLTPDLAHWCRFGAQHGADSNISAAVKDRADCPIKERLRGMV